MISSEKNSAGPTSLQAASMASARSAWCALGQAFQVLVRVLDHHDGGVDHRADGDGDAAQAHQVGVHAQRAHGDEGDQHADRQHQDGDQRAAHVQQEDDADQRDDEASSISVRFSVAMARWISSERS
jgi:hypothetical protein